MAKWNIDWAKFGLGLFIAFIAFQVLSYLLSNWFTSLSSLLNKFALGWLVIILGAIILIVFKLVFQISKFDKKSIFVSLLALTILIGIIVYFGLDFGRLFDMSIVQNQAGSIIKTVGSIISKNI